MKKTFLELRELDGIIVQLYIKTPSLKDTKFAYGYNKFYSKNYQSIYKEFQDAIINVQIENALTDPTTKALITDPMSPRGFKYSMEGLKAVLKAENEINDKFNLKEIECEPYMCRDVPVLNEVQSQGMQGLLIPIKDDQGVSLEKS